MRLWIDGSEISRDVSACRTFGEVLEEAGKRAAARGRVVSRVSVDGREISTNLEREMAARTPGEIGEVRVQTATPPELLHEALDGALALCRAIVRDLRSVVDSLRSGEVTVATSLYASCIESLATFFQLAGAIFNGFRSGAFLLPGRGGTDARELPPPPTSTTEVLERLLSAQKAENWETMADLLEERVVPNLTEWSAFFSAIRGPDPK